MQLIINNMIDLAHKKARKEYTKDIDQTRCTKNEDNIIWEMIRWFSKQLL